MPLYEYQCANAECEKPRFEIIQKFSDDPLSECPTCGAEVRKLLSAPAVHFKGQGWYVTDYGKGGEKPKDQEAKEASGDKGDKSEAKSDKKADAKKGSESGKSESKAPASSAASKG